MAAVEYWVEVNLDAPLPEQEAILLDVLRPYAAASERRGELITYHYFREPEIRFRVRTKTRASKKRQEKALARIANSLAGRGVISEWHFGNHGERGQEYVGEEDRYGRNGWKVAQGYFRNCSDTALAFLDLKRRSRLESPLWSKGLGNPWEGGDDNPWKGKEEDPLVYHWSRFVHLFTNQVGFDMEMEAQLCERQAERYRQVTKRLGMKW